MKKYKIMESKTTDDIPQKTQKKPKTSTMRNHWFAHVAKVRKRLQKASKEAVSHRAAMREASTSWVTEKEKVRKRIARIEKAARRKTQKDT